MSKYKVGDYVRYKPTNNWPSPVSGLSSGVVINIANLKPTDWQVNYENALVHFVDGAKIRLFFDAIEPITKEEYARDLAAYVLSADNINPTKETKQ